MDRVVILSALTILAFGLIIGTTGLSCLPCQKEDCDKNLTIGCKYGITFDICGCCDECAKGPGEECGGIWYQYGRCGEGFVCDPEPGPTHQSAGNCTKDKNGPKSDVKLVATP